MTDTPIKTALIGLGRIGRLHADNLAAHPRFHLAAIHDPDPAAAQEIAAKHTVPIAATVADLLSDPAIAAVLIASPTATHCDLIEQAAQAGKAILCEKPLHLNTARARRCLSTLAAGPAPIFQIGFNRRHDPGHAAVIARVKAGDIGQLEKVIITSRDPHPPSVAYLAASGGLFHDMMIHDFDTARALLPEEPVRLIAAGAALSATCRQANDIDTAMVILQTESGVLCHINCSRRAVYGYDQRIEAFGDGGMLLSNNRTQTQTEWYNGAATAVREPLLNFFVDRYADSFRLQLDAFAAAVTGAAAPHPSLTDGMKALLLADAARESLQTGKWATVPES